MNSCMNCFARKILLSEVPSSCLCLNERKYIKGQKEEAIEMDGLEAARNNSKWSEVLEGNIGARKEFTSIAKAIF